jgi:hypothetical protein
MPTDRPTFSHAAMKGAGKQAVAGFVRGKGQSSVSGKRGVLPICHGERVCRLPAVSGGAYTTKSQ